MDVYSDAIRPPWDLCASAERMLGLLKGTPLSTRPRPAIDSHQQCTHQYDLALLAIAQSARGEGRRQYDIVIPDGEPFAPGEALLFTNGVLAEYWRLDGSVFSAPAPLAGKNLRTAVPWVETYFDDDKAEAFAVLRRGILVSGGRFVALDNFEDTSRGFETMVGACYVFNEKRMGDARRNKGSSRNFEDQPASLLAHLPRLSGG